MAIKALEDVEKEQEKFKADLGYINQGPPQYKSFEQLNVIEKVRNLYNSRENVVKVFNDYAKNMSKSIHELKQEGTGRKILTPNQMRKRLLIALAQMKAGNNSESLLNEIMQIFSLYRSKEITKKVYNNISESIKV